MYVSFVCAISVSSKSPLQAFASYRYRSGEGPEGGEGEGGARARAPDPQQGARAIVYACIVSMCRINIVEVAITCLCLPALLLGKAKRARQAATPPTTPGRVKLNDEAIYIYHVAVITCTISIIFICKCIHTEHCVISSSGTPMDACICSGTSFAYPRRRK